MPYFHSLCDKKSFAAKATPGESALGFWIDFIFVREVFTKCSWAGGSRDKSRPKAAFKQFEHVVKFLMELARTVEPTYTLIATQNFVKGLVQYSKRRNKDPKRRSAPKMRPSGKKNKVAAENEDGVEYDDDDDGDGDVEDFGDLKFNGAEGLPVVFESATQEQAISIPMTTTAAMPQSSCVPATVPTVAANVTIADSGQPLPTFSQTFPYIQSSPSVIPIQLLETVVDEQLVNVTAEHQNHQDTISIQKASLNTNVMCAENGENNKLGTPQGVGHDDVIESDDDSDDSNDDESSTEDHNNEGSPAVFKVSFTK